MPVMTPRESVMVVYEVNGLVCGTCQLGAFRHEYDEIKTRVGREVDKPREWSSEECELTYEELPEDELCARAAATNDAARKSEECIVFVVWMTKILLERVFL